MWTEEAGGYSASDADEISDFMKDFQGSFSGEAKSRDDNFDGGQQKKRG